MLLLPVFFHRRQFYAGKRSIGIKAIVLILFKKMILFKTPTA